MASQVADGTILPGHLPAGAGQYIITAEAHVLAM
jgi:hypothetical protein